MPTEPQVNGVQKLKLLHTSPEQHCDVDRQLSPLFAQVEVPWQRPWLQLSPEQQSLEVAQYRPEVPHEAPHVLLVPVLPVQKRALRQQSALKEHGFAAHDVPPAGAHSSASQFPLQQSTSSKQKPPFGSHEVPLV